MATALVVWAAVLGYTLLVGRSSYPLGVAAAVTAVFAVGWLCADTYELAPAPSWSLYRSPAPTRQFDPRFSRLSQELADASDRRAAARAVHESVVAIAERILLDKYDVDLTASPAAAQALLGEPTAAFLRDGPRRAASVASPELLAVLDRLEAL